MQAQEQSHSGSPSTGLAIEQELSDFDTQNAPAGRLGRFLKGRMRDTTYRLWLNTSIAVGSGIAISPAFGLMACFVLFLMDGLEMVVFRRLYLGGQAVWETSGCRALVLCVTTIIAIGHGYVAYSAWMVQAEPFRMLALSVLIAFSMNSGFFSHLCREANVVRQMIYISCALSFFVAEFLVLENKDSVRILEELVSAIGLVICLFVLFSRLARFSHTRYQSERTLMVARVEAEKVHAAMKHQALHDPLTNLPNRAFLAKTMSQRMNDVMVTGNNLAIFHIDLDKFKEVNDTAGHAAGDFILLHSAEALQSSVRAEDFVARIGGDEFVVVTSTIGSVQELENIATRIIEEVSKPVQFGDQELAVGASVGYAISRPDHKTGEAVLLDADLALYAAKEAGRGVSQIFSPEMRSDFEERTQLMKDLKKGVEGAEIETVFQPQVDLHTNLVTGFEALVRWRHPKRGLISPDQFLPLAEEAGLLNDITITVVEQSLEALSNWRTAGFLVPCVGVNFASGQLQDRDVINKIKWLVEMANLEPEDVTIEVLESVLSSANSDDLIDNIKALSAAGFSIDLDDFGTEHASIANMRSFQVQRIKIDKSFVEDIEFRPDQRRLVSAMVQLAGALDVQVLAEGVETEVQIDILAELGCDQVQGYFFARPMFEADALNWLAECGLIVRANIAHDNHAAIF